MRNANKTIPIGIRLVKKIFIADLTLCLFFSSIVDVRDSWGYDTLARVFVYYKGF